MSIKSKVESVGLEDMPILADFLRRVTEVAGDLSNENYIVLGAQGELCENGAILFTLGIYPTPDEMKDVLRSDRPAVKAPETGMYL